VHASCRPPGGVDAVMLTWLNHLHTRANMCKWQPERSDNNRRYSTRFLRRLQEISSDSAMPVNSPTRVHIR
jgi:hypothetical protein